MTERPPAEFWRVEWEAAVGWPTPDVRRNTARNFTSATAAGRQVAIIQAMPSHLKLHRVLHGTVGEWEPVDIAELPVPNDDPEEVTDAQR